MNAVLLITFTVTVALVYGNNSRPCQPRYYTHNPYKDFVDNHILQWDFDRSLENEWIRYLNETGLCNRQRQTFMEQGDLTSVESICNGNGRQLDPHHSNLCISTFQILVYQVTVGGGCEYVEIESYPHYVIVACDKIGNQCLPVHYEPYNGQYRTRDNPLCTL